jgi:hypothetical protein
VKPVRSYIYQREYEGGRTVWMVRWRDPECSRWFARKAGETAAVTQLVQAVKAQPGQPALSLARLTSVVAAALSARSTADDNQYQPTTTTGETPSRVTPVLRSPTDCLKEESPGMLSQGFFLKQTDRLATFLSGGPGRARTCDLQIRSLTL